MTNTGWIDGLNDDASAEAGDGPPAGWTVAHAFGEIVWLMTRSDGYKHHSIADLEWMVMPALILEQFRIFHEGTQPAGAILWARLDAATGARMQEPRFRLRPDQWRCGGHVWVVDILTPSTADALLPATMLQDFKLKLFPEVSVQLRRLNPQTQTIEILELGAPAAAK